MSYFRKNIDKAKGYEPGFQPKRADIVKLNTNENPYPPSPRVIEALSRMGADQFRRYPDPMGEEFRQVAAVVHGVRAENIMCCNGGDDLLNIAFRAFCDESRPVAYPVPTYSLYPVLAKLQNCRAIEVPFDGEFNLPVKLTKTRAALTIVCNPNAPSGSFVSVGELASLADELSGVLLIDEAYVDFADENCAGLIKDLDNVVVLRSMSKGYGLAGIRFGYAIAQADLIAGLMKVKDSYNVDAVAIALATAAIKDQEYFRQTTAKVKEARELLVEQLRILKFIVPKSHANFVLAECRNCDAGTIYGKLLQRNIYVRYFDLPGLSDRLRITVGTSEQNDRVVLALKEILSEQEPEQAPKGQSQPVAD
ncbi:MAG: histidinol-phosphate transaminase [Phycisphaerales bacterium]|nr:MAG: histidinol-phosphate transaminase [Phycisphaerales bacterium]